MVVIVTLPPPETSVWYLAYGSNLASSKFIGDRGIIPRGVKVVSVPGFTLSMNSAGFPYREPSFASIGPFDLNAYPKEVELLGTAYLVSPEQYTRIIASEGGGTAYHEAQVEVRTILEDGEKLNEGVAEVMNARTLFTMIPRQPEPRPSERYLNLIIDGAAEASYPESYQRHLKNLVSYQPPSKGYRRVGAAIFLLIWTPVMALMEMMTKSSIKMKDDKQGRAPDFIIWLVRTVMFVMWWHHDNIHAPIWGRGDGIDQNMQ
ncbi:hypothetical protein F4777DRAFT_547106 [Nemania sp. FL0916]|nr:hypothetical protein F4777DRAFT_547106 [Nemania sp. FL0916]